ncbi:MAG: hypothetical protein KAR06_01330 [Deltaproteobacteria bacterium]|nr:hypothetical protein [Deltaproteobacteria bacterium]
MKVALKISAAVLMTLAVLNALLDFKEGNSPGTFSIALFFLSVTAIVLTLRTKSNEL